MEHDPAGEQFDGFIERQYGSVENRFVDRSKDEPKKPMKDEDLWGIKGAKDIINLNFPPADPLIDGFVWKGDNIFLVGKEKSGKSILAIQFACALTSGQPLFGKHEVKKTQRVLYVQLEGKLSETKERFLNMLKVNDANLDKLYLGYYPSLALDTPAGIDTLSKDLETVGFCPEVIIIDPLYHAMEGELTQDRDARHMTANLRRLGMMYSCTIIVVHHAHRTRRTESGDILDEGDDAIFGSFVWKAWADHTLLFRKTKENSNMLTCGTQRSGKVTEKTELILVSEEQLSFELKEGHQTPSNVGILDLLTEAGPAGMLRPDIMAAAKLGESTVDRALRKLIESGLVVKDRTKRPSVYWKKGMQPEGV